LPKKKREGFSKGKTIKVLRRFGQKREESPTTVKTAAKGKKKHKGTAPVQGQGSTSLTLPKSRRKEGRVVQKGDWVERCDSPKKVRLANDQH